jgi:hypothetical protein
MRAPSRRQPMLLALVLAAAARCVTSFYLPGVAPRNFVSNGGDLLKRKDSSACAGAMAAPLLHLPFCAVRARDCVNAQRCVAAIACRCC